MTREETLIERVRKLLALAESPNENEAALAAEKAQELMLRYGIELAQVAATKGTTIGVTHEDFEGKLDPWRRMLASSVAESLGGEFVFASEYRKWTGRLEFWGERGTVPSMVALYQYLEGQLVAISALAAAERGRTVGFKHAADSMRWRRSFQWGAASRVGARLSARRKEVASQGDNSKALVVLKSAVDRALEEQYPDLEKARTKIRLDPQAAHAGREAGDRVDLGDAKLSKGLGALPSATK